MVRRLSCHLEKRATRSIPLILDYFPIWRPFNGRGLSPKVFYISRMKKERNVFAKFQSHCPVSSFLAVVYLSF